jgi:lysozyme
MTRLDILDEACKQISMDEGYKAKPYFDTEQVLTIGIGFAIRDLTLAEKAILGNLNEVTYLDSLKVLFLKVSRVYDELSARLPWITQLPGMVQVGILDLTYQVGVDGLLKYKKMLLSLTARDYINAELEEMDSKEARQTPKRALHIKQLIQSGSENVSS